METKWSVSLAGFRATLVRLLVGSEACSWWRASTGCEYPFGSNAMKLNLRLNRLRSSAAQVANHLPMFVPIVCAKLGLILLHCMLKHNLIKQVISFDNLFSLEHLPLMTISYSTPLSRSRKKYSYNSFSIKAGSVCLASIDLSVYAVFESFALR